MNLRVARIGKRCPLSVGPPCRRHIAIQRIGGKIEDVSIAPCGKDHGVSRMSLNGPRDNVAGNDSACVSVNRDQFEHFVIRIHANRTQSNLPAQTRVSPEKQLLSRLATCVKCSRYLSTAKRPVRQ